MHFIFFDKQMLFNYHINTCVSTFLKNKKMNDLKRKYKKKNNKVKDINKI